MHQPFLEVTKRHNHLRLVAKGLVRVLNVPVNPPAPHVQEIIEKVKDVIKKK
jgi:hypothetical protein